MADEVDFQALPRRRLLQLGVAAGALAMPAIARAKTDHIVVASPGGPMDDAFERAYIQPFTAKTGISVVKTTNQYAKLKAMVDANSVEWDVMDTAGDQAALFTKQGLTEPLDLSAIDPNGLLPGTLNPNFVLIDVVGACVSWNTQRVKGAAAPSNWAEVWDLKRFTGDRMFWKKPNETLEVALLADGVPMSSLYPLDVPRALRSLDKIKSHISWWDSGAQSAQLLIDGEAAAGMAWNGRLAGPKSTGAPVDFTFNQALLITDALIIPRGCKNKAEAMAFIAFVLEPDSQARFANIMPYGPVRISAMQQLSPARQAIMPTAPENYAKGVAVNGDWWTEHGSDAVEKFNTWLLA